MARCRWHKGNGMTARHHPCVTAHDGMMAKRRHDGTIHAVNSVYRLRERPSLNRGILDSVLNLFSIVCQRRDVGHPIAFVHRKMSQRERTSEGGSMALRLRDNAPDGRGILPDDKSRGVVAATTAIATCSVVLSDMVGGALAVVAVAKEGEYFGEYRLTEHTVMLLCQSARNVTVLRALPLCPTGAAGAAGVGEQRAGGRGGAVAAGSADRE